MNYLNKSAKKLVKYKNNRIFVILYLFLFVFTGFAFPQANTDTAISINIKDASLEKIFNELEKKSGYEFAYGGEIRNANETFSIEYENTGLRSVLNNLSSQAGFEYRIGDYKVSVKKLQKQTISGTVTDSETGEPLVGVTVSVKGTQEGTIADINGKYSIAAFPGAVIKFSYIGYKPLALEAGSHLVLNVSLEPESFDFDEVVVVGYANQNKADVTGSVDGLNAGSFNNGVVSSPEQLFQGKLAGVHIINSSGEPGAGIDVLIRGAGSIRSGNDPLFVVDGVPLSNDNVSPAGVNDGIGTSRARNPLNFLNPADIESISVLKDASASAIYGARGSNGVIIITTKKGKGNEADFTFDSYLGVSKIANKIDLLTGAEYAKVNPEHTHVPNASTDWQDAIMRTAYTTNNNFSFSNSSKTGSYYMSLSHMGQEGIIKESAFERLAGRFNVTESFFNDQRLRVNINLTASQLKDNGAPTSDNGGATGELITHMLKANPTRPVYDQNGEIYDFDTEGSYNPVYMLHFYDDHANTLRVLSNIEAKYRLVKGLEYQLNLGVDRSVSERNTTYFPNTTEIENTGSYFEQKNEMHNSLIEHFLTYDLQFKNNRIIALSGFSYQKFNRSGTIFGVTEFEDNGIDPSNNPGISGNQEEIEARGYAEINELQSFFGRINYSNSGKYYLTASLRADGSTRFGENNKYGYFPSLAVAWNIGRENFLNQQGAISDLKLRASWGQTGNQEVPNKVTQETYSITSSNGYYMNGKDKELINGIIYTRTSNPDLKWEVVTQTNLGADFNFFSGKLRGTLDYFRKSTTDAILLIPAIQPNFSDIWTNMNGEIVNTGIEVTLGSDIVKSSDFKWYVDVNCATLDNEVKNLPVSEILSGSVSGSGVSGETVNIYKNGYAAGSFYLWDHQGFDENGLSIYGPEKILIESALPTFTFGLHSIIDYKNFSLSFSINGQKGAYLFNNTKLATNTMSNLFSSKNISQDVLNSGQSANDGLVVSDYYLEKSDYLRLNNIRFAYTFNESKIKAINQLTVYASAQNLFTLTQYSGFDPVVNTSRDVNGNSSLGMDYASYPSAKTFMFGTTIKF
ncbi:MAG: SusC/RagA family TonB-linked outer membrane protein [Bacteroidales bacterium]|nr:SusC/RagA family TonB-linked outer membrane protein [Bacteroidales bacterium]